MVATTAPFGATASEPAVVYLPACYEADPARRFPVLYLLHGAGNTEQQWPDVGIAAAADAVIGSGDIGPMIIVLPNGGPGLPHTLVEQVSDQLNPWADTTYRTIAQRSGRAIGGISRGGAIALLAAAAHPELFQAVGGHSPPPSTKPTWPGCPPGWRNWGPTRSSTSATTTRCATAWKDSPND